LSKLLLAAAVSLLLALPAPATFAAPAESAPFSRIADWLAALLPFAPAPVERHTDASEALPTLDPNGITEAPSPTLTTVQTGEGDGEALPTLDPDG